MPRARIFRQVDQDLPEAGKIENHYGEDRAQLDEHIEGSPERVLQPQGLAGQQQMAGGRHRDEFGQALDDAEQHSHQPVMHATSSRWPSAGLTPVLRGRDMVNFELIHEMDDMGWRFQLRLSLAASIAKL